MQMGKINVLLKATNIHCTDSYEVGSCLVNHDVHFLQVRRDSYGTLAVWNIWDSVFYVANKAYSFPAEQVNMIPLKFSLKKICPVSYDSCANVPRTNQFSTGNPHCMLMRPINISQRCTELEITAVNPVWRGLFEACEFDADQFGLSHFDAMPVWRATVSCVFQFDAWQFGAFCQFGALFIFNVFFTCSHIRHCTGR